MKNPLHFIISLLIIVLIGLLPQLLQAQNDYQWEWATSLVGDKNTQLNYVRTDGAGNAYLLGQFAGNTMKVGWEELKNQEDRGIFLIKLNPKGEVLWKKNITGSSSFTVAGMEIDQSGNCVLTGTYYSEYVYVMGERLENFSATDNTADVFLARVSPEGDLLWAKTFPMQGNDEVSLLRLDGFGQPYLMFTGEFKAEAENKRFKFSLGGRRIAKTALKFSVEGKLLWELELMANEVTRVGFLHGEVDFEGNYYLAGTNGGEHRTHLGSHKLRNLLPDYEKQPYFILKISPEGELLWIDQTKSIIFELDELGNMFFLLQLSGNFISDNVDIGQTHIESQEGEDMALIKFDSEGTFETYSTFGSLTTPAANRPSQLVLGYDYGKDGYLYVLREFLDEESLIGEHRIKEPGLYLLQFNEDGEVTKLLHIAHEGKNPLINAGRVLSNKSRITDISITLDGKMIIAGHQYDQLLILGGHRLTNPTQVHRGTGVYVAKLSIEKE